MVGGCCGTTTDAHQGARRDAARASPMTASVQRPRRRTGRDHAAAGLAVSPPCRCARRMPTSRSASAATPTARRSSASCRRRATGTAASPWAATSSGKGRTRLDLCTAFVGRDEVADMTEVIDADARPGRRAAGLRFDRVRRCSRRRSSSMAARASSTRSISRTARRRRTSAWRSPGSSAPRSSRSPSTKPAWPRPPTTSSRIARRLVDFACDRYGLPQSDLLIDPLTFTICTGNEDDRKLGLWTLEAIERIRDEFPEIQIILGLSNISFGLNPAARHVLNSVLLDHAHAARADRGHRPFVQDHAAAPDSARGGAGGRGPDLRPPARRLRPAAGLHGALRRPQGRRRRRRRSGRRRSRSA